MTEKPSPLNPETVPAIREFLEGFAIAHQDIEGGSAKLREMINSAHPVQLAAAIGASMRAAARPEAQAGEIFELKRLIDQSDSESYDLIAGCKRTVEIASPNDLQRLIALLRKIVIDRALLELAPILFAKAVGQSEALQTVLLILELGLVQSREERRQMANGLDVCLGLPQESINRRLEALIAQQV